MHPFKKNSNSGLNVTHKIVIVLFPKLMVVKKRHFSSIIPKYCYKKFGFEKTRIMNNEFSLNFEYDAGGQRIRKTYTDIAASINLSDLVYVNGFYTIDVKNNAVNKHISDGSYIIATKVGDNNDAILYYHQNHIGSTAMLTDKNGAVFQEYLFKPYGETWITGGMPSDDITRLFTGQEFDSETGMYYMNARYYDPSLAVFICPDPAMQGNNHYSYVNCKPITFNDPTGKDCHANNYTSAEDAWQHALEDGYDRNSGGETYRSTYGEDAYNVWMAGGSGVEYIQQQESAKSFVSDWTPESQMASNLANMGSSNNSGFAYNAPNFDFLSGWNPCRGDYGNQSFGFALGAGGTTWDMDKIAGSGSNKTFRTISDDIKNDKKTITWTITKIYGNNVKTETISNSRYNPQRNAKTLQEEFLNKKCDFPFNFMTNRDFFKNEDRFANIFGGFLDMGYGFSYITGGVAGLESGNFGVAAAGIIKGPQSVIWGTSEIFYGIFGENKPFMQYSPGIDLFLPGLPRDTFDWIKNHM
jgi:RHS repeat-associated protein